MRKGQGATEYLIILAVVVVIALILIGVLGGIPGIGGGAGGQTNSAYWNNQPVAISSAAISAAGDDTVVLKNNVKNAVSVTAVAVGGENPTTPALPVTIGPGETATLVFDQATDDITCTAGQQYSGVVSITYTDSVTGGSYTEDGDGNNLVVTCAN